MRYRASLHCLFRIMRATTFLLLCCLAQVSARSNAQSVTLRVENMALADVFKTLHAQTGYDFVFTTRVLERAQPVTLSFSDMDLADALTLIFDGQPLDYKFLDRSVVVKATAHEREPGGKKNLVATAGMVLAYEEVRGRVVDSLGQPLPGASVRVLNAEGKRTTLQTKTDRDGEFVLRNVPQGANLEISYIGYITVEVLAESNLGVTVLQAAPSALKEVIINKGYYTTTERLNTGSVARVTSEQIESQPVANPLVALQGLAPGVLVTQSSGIPGASVNIQIRGRNSLAQGSRPLYIVDGVPFGNENSGSTATLGWTVMQNAFNLLNPADIESIEILKDADATAIYGSRGANGVVLITTKKGKASTTNQLSIRAVRGFSELPRRLELLSTAEYLQMRREAFANDGVEPTIENAPDLLVWDTTRYTDWQKVLAGNPAAYTDVQAQYAGGTANTQFLLSTSYHHDESTLLQPNQGNRRMTSMLNVAHQFGKEKGTINAGINYTLARNRIPYSSINSYSSAISLAPNAPPLYDENGKLNWADGTWTNPIAQAHQIYDYQSGNFNGHATATYYLLPQLYVKANAGLTILNTSEHYAYPKEARNPSSTAQASASFGSAVTQNWIVEPQVGYNVRFGGSKMEVLVGASWQENTFQNLLTHGYDYTSDQLLRDVSSAGRTVSYSGASTYAYTAIFGRLSYNWKDKHVLNATVRRDGSSRFGPGRRFANFGSLGYAYIFTEEVWLKNQLPMLSFGKLRMSYGTTGNDQIGDYQYLDTYTSNYLEGYEGVPPLIPTELFNPDYQWESTRKVDVGLDLGFLNDRISISAAYFLTRSSNQLLTEKLPSQTGFTGVTTNQEAVLHNSGVELMVNTTNIDNGQFRWTSSINMTFPRDKLISYPGLAKSSYAQTYIVGKSYTQSWYGYRYLGVNPDTGLYDFLDVNGDGQITSIYDRLQYEQWPRAYYGGLSNRLTFKGVSLDVMLYYRHQTVSGAYLRSRPGSMANQLRRVYENAWRAPGDVTDIPKFSAVGAESSARHILMYSASGAVKDASYLRLRNVSLAYELPRAWLKGVGVKSVSLHADAQNLVTWSGYDKSDPESQNPNYLPPLRTYVFGASISF